MENIVPLQSSVFSFLGLLCGSLLAQISMKTGRYQNWILPCIAYMARIFSLIILNDNFVQKSQFTLL
uniref:Putative ovule protein n=1 Tax=Solanum chacoense TaxID=4108 RepID=A0A0V0GQV1_SOLCH